MIDGFLAWIEGLPFSVAIAEGLWLFPAIESLHVLALAIVFGSIAMIDLRLLNVTLKTRDVVELTREVLPWTWGAFAVSVITGSLMFSSAATRYYGLWPFKLKMILLLLAGVNMLIFHLGSYRHVAQWGAGGPTPVAARLSGGASLLLWTTIIVCGRVVGFL